MGRKQKITGERIVSKGIELIRTNGFDHISTRNIAKSLECSTQPIYSYFKTIDQLHEALIEETYHIMIDDYMTKAQSGNPFLDMGLGMIRFAKNDSQLFAYLYFSPFGRGISHENHEKLIDTMEGSHDLDGVEREVLERIHERISLFTHGLAATVMQRPDLYSDQEIQMLLSDAALAISAYEGGKT